MKDGRPSVTAMYVAFARAVATHDPKLSAACNDPVAEQLLPLPWRELVALAKGAPYPALAFEALRRASLGLVDHVALRTGLIDAALKSGLAAGLRQVVLLGAGLDARAHRIDELRDSVVFEVDHPSTQRLKLRKAQSLPVKARALHYAGSDFLRISLEHALAEAGFDPSHPSVWIWEGVTMYLDAAAIDGTLDELQRLSAPGSKLIATYVTPALTARRSLVTDVALAGLAMMSEPIRSQHTPAKMQARLALRGFELESDVSPRACADQFGVRVTRLAWGMPDERLIVARQR